MPDTNKKVIISALLLPFILGMSERPKAVYQLNDLIIEKSDNLFDPSYRVYIPDGSGVARIDIACKISKRGTFHKCAVVKSNIENHHYGKIERYANSIIVSTHDRSGIPLVEGVVHFTIQLKIENNTDDGDLQG